MNKINLFQIDPRPAGQENNLEFIKENGKVLGIEVTQPQYEELLIGNLDHHREGDTQETPSASIQALEYQGKQPNAMVTSKLDADSATAMAIISNKFLIQKALNPEIITEVDLFDRFGPKNGTDNTVAISRIAGDFNKSVTERVGWILDFLISPEEKKSEVNKLVSAQKRDLDAAEKATYIEVYDNKVAFIQSSHRNAPELGYRHADILVCHNPHMPIDFKDPSKGTYQKFTICKRDTHIQSDLEAVLKELQELESGWGGRDTIFGSPQGQSSKLSPEKIIEIVKKYTN